MPNGSEVYSGGSDFFLAGRKRAVENNFVYGVHSWSKGERDGASYPKNSEQHNLFIQIYKKLGIDVDFYWFTLQQAPASGMYKMSLDEMKKFGLINATYDAVVK